MKFSHSFTQDLADLMHEAEHGEPFAFVRFADGERAILENKVDTRTADGWKIGNEWMRKALHQALIANLPRYVRGVPCPCCDIDGHPWYVQAILGDDDCYGPAPLTYSNLFVNGNYDTALPWLRGLARNWCVVSSAWGSDIRVPADWSKIKDLESLVGTTFSKMDTERRPLLVAAGPLGKLLIHRYWRDGWRANTILDIGSAIDPDLFGRNTRGYHDGHHPNRKKVCTWELNAARTSGG